jgi:SnoaL-like domain
MYVIKPKHRAHKEIRMGVRPAGHEQIADRLAIAELIALYSRALDRMDLELARSCWWPEGTDDHAPLYVGPIEGFWEWLWPVHRTMTLTRHVVTNTVAAFSGQIASTESYWTATMRIPTPDGPMDLQSGGRYVDRFEQRGGEWRFIHRQSIREWGRTDPADTAGTGSPITSLIVPNDPGAPVTPSRRDRSDYSYAALGNPFGHTAN